MPPRQEYVRDGGTLLLGFPVEDEKKQGISKTWMKDGFDLSWEFGTYEKAEVAWNNPELPPEHRPWLHRLQERTKTRTMLPIWTVLNATTRGQTIGPDTFLPTPNAPTALHPTSAARQALLPKRLLSEQVPGERAAWLSTLPVHRKDQPEIRRVQVPLARFEQWPLQGAVLKRVTLGGSVTFQLEFAWDMCTSHQRIETGRDDSSAKQSRQSRVQFTAYEDDYSSTSRNRSGRNHGELPRARSRVLKTRYYLKLRDRPAATHDDQGSCQGRDGADGMPPFPRSLEPTDMMIDPALREKPSEELPQPAEGMIQSPNALGEEDNTREVEALLDKRTQG
ncbi:hypothetical protein DL768_008572 [Monosporascus sp. mg162]|nr:hypothetical protein DL768_008572 [Monosporascus sp. mg162]